MKYIKLFEKFYSPPKEVKEKLHKIVQNLIKKHKGGREFFNALDDSIKSITNQEMILALLKGSSNEWIASSGSFGDIIYDLWKAGKFKCKGLVVFNGKMLTKNKGVTNWYPVDFDLNDKEFRFVDDSFFSGSTYKKVRDFLKDHNSTIKEVSVIYDGSKMKTNIVKSFFRYYNG